MNIFNRFKKKATAPITTPATSTAVIPDDHISQKKKNTYIVTFNVMAQLDLFDMCQSTPLPIICINGQELPKTGFIQSRQFPNPCASDMAKKHSVLAEVMGDKISTTIIEYLDKETGKPVVQVYPEMMHIFDGYEADYMQHLNHASRQDLKKQIALRERLINEFIAKKQLQK
ncbi:MAG: hypothetical protein IJX89_03775 [Alphaproteobacteria bacterium]|nr:hypothetical protein [Alphaproteobacteria bacterium]